MKNINIAILSALLSIMINPAAGQSRVDITQNQYALKGDSVYVALTVGMNEARIARRAFVLLTPTITQGSVSMELPPIMINGKNRAKAYRRLVALNRAPVGVGQVISADAKSVSRTYLYVTVFAYEPWMKEAVLTMREDQCVCNGPLLKMEFDFNGSVMQDLNPPAAPPVRIIEENYFVSFKEPNPEPVKNRCESGKAYLDFARGQSAIDSDLGNNYQELSEIGSMIRRIDSDPYTTIKQVVIDGYASPEGSYATNMTLSAKRAAALKDYLKTVYALPERLFRVTGHGEDWATLEELVEALDFAWKQPALDIIRGTDVFDGREKKLMDLQGGYPYRYMFVNLFPKLRRSDYELKYTVIPFTVEQGKTAIKSSPFLLSLNEMFLVARDYPIGSADYNEVFEIAARVYPDSDIANLNAAANALAAKNTAAAQVYLEKVSDRDAAWLNNMGVVSALRGEYEKAATLFEAAKAAGNAEAAKNLSKIAKLSDIL